MADVSSYTSLITSQHSQRPLFKALVALLCQYSVDVQNLYAKFPDLFDVDKAVGDQLNKLGQWVGAKRNIAVPITGVFFSLDTPGLGLNQGTWFSELDANGIYTLPDDSYRVLIKFVIASNQWDGTIPGAYQNLNQVFLNDNIQMLIQDNQDMSINIIFLSSSLDAVTTAMLKSGVVAMRPAGVRVAGYFKAIEPVFGLDINNNLIGGLDKGNWLQTSQL